MTDTDIRRLLSGAGIPPAYQSKGATFKDKCPRRGTTTKEWLKTEGLLKLTTGAALIIVSIEEEDSWRFNLIQTYLVLHKKITARFDAYELREMTDEAWQALEECQTIFLEGLTDFQRQPEHSETLAYFIKVALERNIGIVFLNGRSNDIESVVGERIGRLIHSRCI